MINKIEVVERARGKSIEYETDNNGCWNCVSHAKEKDGYPVIQINGKQFRMNRYIYLRRHRAIPVGMVVRHKCDNRSCINPSHLEVGTVQDNVNDKMARGRQIRGEAGGNSKLTQLQVDAIRKDTRYQKDVALQYGINQTHVSRIKNNVLWVEYDRKLTDKEISEYELIEG